MQECCNCQENVREQGGSSRIFIGPADFPPPMGEGWFFWVWGLSLRPEGPKIEAQRADARGPKGRRARPEGPRPRAGVGFLWRGQ